MAAQPGTEKQGRGATSRQPPGRSPRMRPVMLGHPDRVGCVARPSRERPSAPDFTRVRRSRRPAWHPPFVSQPVSAWPRHGPDHQRARPAAPAGLADLRSQLHRRRAALRRAARSGRPAGPAHLAAAVRAARSSRRSASGSAARCIWVLLVLVSGAAIIGVFRYVGPGTVAGGRLFGHRRARRGIHLGDRHRAHLERPADRAAHRVVRRDRRRDGPGHRRPAAHAPHRRGHRARLAAADGDRRSGSASASPRSRSASRASAAPTAPSGRPASSRRSAGSRRGCCTTPCSPPSRCSPTPASA